MSDSITLKRIYDEVLDSSYRVLVDRLWPRGVSREAAHLDEWLKDVAPSTGLRTWYDHKTERFTEFARRYQAELREPPALPATEHLVSLATSHNVVLLTATRDVEHSGARVLIDRIFAMKGR